MMLVSVRFSPKFSFDGQVAMCEIKAIDAVLGVKRIYEGLTFKDAFNKFERSIPMTTPIKMRMETLT